jgi:hypothetical protein
MLWKNIKKVIGFISAVILILLSAHAYETVNFIRSAERTEARVTQGTNSVVGNNKVAFTTPQKNTIAFETELPAAYRNKQQVPVLYNPLIPSQVTVDDFYQIWIKPVWFLTALLFLLLMTVAADIVCKRNQRKCKKILQGGNHIYTKYLCVEAQAGYAKDAAKAYQIITSWHDKEGTEHQFKSQKLKFNPLDYMLDQTIKVMIDKKNKKHYLMDLSFLPPELLNK